MCTFVNKVDCVQDRFLLVYLCIVNFCAISYFAISCFAISCFAISCFAISCFAISCADSINSNAKSVAYGAQPLLGETNNTIDTGLTCRVVSAYWAVKADTNCLPSTLHSILLTAAQSLLTCPWTPHARSMTSHCLQCQLLCNQQS